MRAYPGNVSHLGQRVEVIDTDVPVRPRPCNIKVAAVRVGRNVIESAAASDELNFEDLVRAAVLRAGEAREQRHQSEYCRYERFA
jgi:hypothetical protein